MLGQLNVFDLYLVTGAIVQCITFLAQAVTSQAENKEPLKRVVIVIMPTNLFETNGFRINCVNLIEDICSITDTLGF